MRLDGAGAPAMLQVMKSERDNAREAVEVARRLMAQYGDDAQVVAMMRTSEYGFSGDLEGYAFWEMVIAAIEVLGDAQTPPRADA